MRVYHGSYTAVTEIDLEKCQWGKDFGRGFYVSKLRSQAEIWAKRMGAKHRGKGVVTEFEFKEHVCRFARMKFLRFDGYTEPWLDFIILNRANETERQAHDYDVVEGNVADDEVAARVFDYQNSLVTKADLLKELEHKAPNHQLCFCTVQSLQALIPSGNEADLRLVHIDNEIVKALLAHAGLNETAAADIYYQSKTYSQLANPVTGLYKRDWTEIYELLKQEIGGVG